MSEMCLWTLNNMILQDKSSSIEHLVNNDIFRAIKIVLAHTNITNQIKASKKKHQYDSIKREVFWMLSYITNYNE